MSSNVVNQIPYLRTSRTFPTEDTKLLAVELDKSYVDIALHVNTRTIGIYPQGTPAITGDNYYLTSQRQQSQRQIYTFTTTAAIPHNINLPKISFMTRMYGQFLDNTTGNWYGLIAGSNVVIAGQISFYLSPTNINFLSGVGAPALSKGIITLEWLSQI